MKPLPLAKPDFDERELEAVRRVLDSGWVVQGREVEHFEDAIAQLQGSRHCIAVASGTAALHVCYLALGFGPGDAVFVPSFAWPSAANMAVLVGARPVFVDVLPTTYNVDPASLDAQVWQCIRSGWGRPRAVVPVHQFGLSADVQAIAAIARTHGMEIVEDAACALGASFNGRPVGCFGQAGIFSFHPRKAITTGEGGAIVTNDDDLAHRCRVLRNHGQDNVAGKRDFHVASVNYRLTEFQAAIGRVQLEKWSEISRRRSELSVCYRERLSQCWSIQLPEFSPEHTWQTMMVVLDDGVDREEVIAALSSMQIQAGPGSVAGHCAAVYRERYGYQETDFPESARLHHQGLALPLYSGMATEDVTRCAQALNTVVADRVSEL